MATSRPLARPPGAQVEFLTHGLQLAGRRRLHGRLDLAVSRLDVEQRVDDPAAVLTASA